LKSGDVLKVISDTASSLDVVASFIDEISTWVILVLHLLVILLVPHHSV
jgi:TusA-related sulfurtransferase